MSTQNQVISFIADFTGVDEVKVKPETLVNDDLGVDGDDGIELLENFSDRFDVDLSSMTKNYFGSEGFPFLSVLAWPFLLLLSAVGVKKKRVEEYAPLPVSSFITATEKKKWIEP